ncbi:pirin family protein [Bacteroides sp. 224]|uniref:pirin family protein n=1 Tax=Bacteroides sp. 224 TaxID=2302936 RepID=UPI0013D7895E|nr:pirin family protein [Bacteroides sp. 224]NDV66168.1 pirin family protein [Bacteroides sp. 224]
MKTILHKANTRGHSLYNWLNSHHTFSFDQYYDPERVNFGALRVLNDDWVAPGEGFGTHPHKNMEIISIPLKGALQHGDSHNNSKVVTPGDIQTMSAGTGIYHSEMNHSQTEAVEFLQIWVLPRTKNTHPIYKDYDIRPLLKKNELALIVAPDGSAPASMLQDTWFSIGEFEVGKTIDYKMHGKVMGVYIFLIEGEIKVDGTVLSRRDGLGIYDTDHFSIETMKDSHILLMEVPML